MKLRFEKFERKYNFYLPDSYKLLITELGDSYMIGNCEFFSAEDFINNNLRSGGEMEVGLFPFGGLGNGDCFCFLKYGENPEEYYIVLWLSETCNYVILNSTFDNFIYNCLIQEYKALLYPDEYMVEGTREEYEECIDKIGSVSSLFDFDLDLIEKAKDEDALDSLILKRDPFAVQLLCMLGKKLLYTHTKEAEKYLNRAINFSPDYAAHYYILGKYLLDENKKEGLELLYKCATVPIAASGYSYWEEDDVGVPRNLLDEVFEILTKNKDELPHEYAKSIYMNFIMKGEPYDPDARFMLADEFLKSGDYIHCIRELNNVMILTDDPVVKIKLLETLMPVYEKAGFVWASSICRKDIKYIRGLKKSV